MKYRDENGITKLTVLIIVIIIIALLIVAITIIKSTKSESNFVVTDNGTKIYFEVNDDYAYNAEASNINSRLYTKETDTGYINIEVETNQYETEEFFEYIEYTFKEKISDEYSNIQISEIESEIIGGKDVLCKNIEYNYTNIEYNVSFIVYELEDKQGLYIIRSE